MSRRFILAPLALALAQVAHADSPIEKNVPINADGRLEVNNVRGEVDIRTWDRNELELRGNLGSGSTLEVSGSGASVSVEVKTPDSGRSWFWGGNGPREDTRLEIRVPKGISPGVHVVSADVTIDGLDGGREVEVESVSGDIRLGSRAQRWELHSVSGDIHASGSAQRGSFETVSGDIHAEGVSGDISAESVSGDAHVDTSAPISEFKGNSVSGNITITGALAARGRIKIESMSGDVQVSLRGEPSASIEAETFSGSVNSDFGRVDREEFGPGERLRTRVGGGEGDIDLKSFSGDVTIRKR